MLEFLALALVVYLLWLGSFALRALRYEVSRLIAPDRKEPLHA